MPGEKMNRSNRLSRSSLAISMNNGQSKEFFWGCQLTKETAEVTWDVADELHGEDDDSDYLEHTLFLRHAVLGAKATDGETNIVEVQTKNFQGEIICQPLISLTKGRTDMCYVDMNFSQGIPATFKLTHGTGPVFLSAQQFVEFPCDDDDDEMTEDESIEEEEEEEEVVSELPVKNGQKRKAPNPKNETKAKKGKLESDESDEEDEMEAEDEDSNLDDSSEFSEASPEKPIKKKVIKKSQPKQVAGKSRTPQAIKAKKPVAKKQTNKCK